MFSGYSKNPICVGDVVIAYMSPEAMAVVQVAEGQTYNNRYGTFKHDEMIGKGWGSLMYSHNKKGTIYLLHPTPELWTQVLNHRTQILYMPDISLITAQLGLRPGSIVVESGTGSGSFSHSLARTISPNGRLFTFEFHDQRASTAKVEFETHKLSSIITIECRDVCKNGFGLENVADAVFLDLPSPWEAIAAAKLALKKGHVGRICSFSPCVEQIQKCGQALADNGFFDIRMFEVLIRPYEVRKVVPRAIEKLKPNVQCSDGEKKRKSDVVEEQEAEVAGKKRKVDEEEADVVMKAEVVDGIVINAEKVAVNPLDGAFDPPELAAEILPNPATLENLNTPPQNTKDSRKKALKVIKVDTDAFATEVTVTRPATEIRGHTSYLLFASVLPK
ncbi:tRNA (adenine(58)-N(1))-methyltransferase catalytic subunit trmt61a [Phlyctochytrium planicorne]|nr:tRNA (adenine(58)-N(1))-methyltransferase catalytic subunit trmt61a [Phlyctochytrium planicorne]